jgi:hypothetical protein
VFSGVFIAAGVYGVGDKESTMVYVQKLSEAFFNVSLMQPFFFKKKSFPPWDSSPHMSYYQDF